MNSESPSVPTTPSEPPAEKYTPLANVVPPQAGAKVDKTGLSEPLPGETPLQYVQRSLQSNPNRAVVVPPPAPDPKPPENVIFQKEEPSPPKEEPPKEEPPKEEPQVPQDSADLNFKKLRGSLKETSTKLQTAEAELQKLREENEKLQTGTIVPKAIEEKEAEIARLRRYEKIVDLKLSPEYEQKYIKPLSEIDSKIETIAKDYEIPSEVVKKALTITNRAELNRFLVNHFDEIGALEVKNLVTEAQQLQTQAQEAEKEPEKAIQSLREEHQRIRESKHAERRGTMHSVSREVWSESLSRIQAEGKALELIPKSTDPVYTEKYVAPIIGAASTEYGKIVSMLVENGLEALPRDLAYALARMCQLAHASASSLETRSMAIARAEELERNVQRTSRYERPPIGAAHAPGTGQVHAPTPPLTPDSAAEKLLKQQGF